jgi:hypothetical protein
MPQSWDIGNIFYFPSEGRHAWGILPHRKNPTASAVIEPLDNRSRQQQWLHQRSSTVTVHVHCLSLSCSSSPISGFLDDYAFLIRGLLDLYEACFDPYWLEWAEVLQDQQDRMFWDDNGAAYFTSPAGDTSILIRLKEGELCYFTFSACVQALWRSAGRGREEEMYNLHWSWILLLWRNKGG